MTLSQADAERLRHAGFLESEIMELAEAKTAIGADQPQINLDSPVWQAVIKSRREWWIDKLDRGWTEHEIVNELENYYRRDKGRNPFDFLKAEYKPPKKVDYIEIIRKRYAEQIGSELEGYRLQQNVEGQGT